MTSRNEKRKLTRKKNRIKANKIALRNYKKSDVYLMRMALIRGVLTQVIIQTIEAMKKEKEVE